MIELRNIEKSYPTKSGRRVILDDINGTFERGHSYGILGLNGAGKSTLLRIISGAEQPTLGDIRKDVSISWPLGFTGSFNGSLSGIENLRFVCRIYDADIDEVTDFVTEFAELGAAIDEPVRTYSTGMRSRLAFGLSMAINFQVYVIDESLAVGDYTFQDKCHREFEARREQADILLTSHAIETIKVYCDRAGVLHKGRFTMFDSVDEAAEFYERVNS